MSFFKNLFNKNSDKEAYERGADHLRINLEAKIAEEHLAKEEYYQAIEHLKEYFKLVARNNFSDLENLNKPCHYNLGLAYLNTNQFNEAIQSLTKCIEIDKNCFEAYLLRINCYFEVDEIQKAFNDIDYAVKLRPDRDDLFMNKGIAYLKIRDVENARIAFTNAKLIGNPDADYYLNKYC